MTLSTILQEVIAFKAKHGGDGPRECRLHPDDANAIVETNRVLFEYFGKREYVVQITGEIPHGAKFGKEALGCQEFYADATVPIGEVRLS